MAEEQAPGRRRIHWLIKAVFGTMTLAAVSCGAMFVNGYRSAAESAAFAAAAIPAFTQPWESRELIARADPDLLRDAPAEKLGKLIAFAAKRLGPLKRCAPIQNGFWRSNFGTGPGFISEHYADCTFENADARVTLMVSRRRGKYAIRSIHFNSDALLE